MPNTRYEPKGVLVRARDELPETFDALAQLSLFGPAALERRAEDVMHQVWGMALAMEAQEALPNPLLRYVGKLIARTLITPGLDYWRKQLTSQAAGTQEQISYADRGEELKELDKRLAIEIAELRPYIDVIVPEIVRPAGDVPHVQQAGRLETAGASQMFTPHPYDLPPLYGPPEDTDNLS